MDSPEQFPAVMRTFSITMAMGSWIYLLQVPMHLGSPLLSCIFRVRSTFMWITQQSSQLLDRRKLFRFLMALLHGPMPMAMVQWIWRFLALEVRLGPLGCSYLRLLVCIRRFTMRPSKLVPFVKVFGFLQLHVILVRLNSFFPLLPTIPVFFVFAFHHHHHLSHRHHHYHCLDNDGPPHYIDIHNRRNDDPETVHKYVGRTVEE